MGTARALGRRFLAGPIRDSASGLFAARARARTLFGTAGNGPRLSLTIGRRVAPVVLRDWFAWLGGGARRGAGAEAPTPLVLLRPGLGDLVVPYGGLVVVGPGRVLNVLVLGPTLSPTLALGRPVLQDLGCPGEGEGGLSGAADRASSNAMPPLPVLVAEGEDRLDTDRPVPASPGPTRVKAPVRKRSARLTHVPVRNARRPRDVARRGPLRLPRRRVELSTT